MKLSELCKKKEVSIKEIEFEGCEFGVLLFTAIDADKLEQIPLSEQLGKLIFEDGKSIEELGCVDDFKANFTIAFQKRLLEKIMEVNKTSATIEELKKN